MSIIVNRDSTQAEDHPYVTIHRHIRRDGPHNVGVGVSEWTEPSGDFDADSESEAHDVPEVHYVLSGVGVLYEEGVAQPVRAGDAIVTPPGRRHVMWATSPDPLVTVYVAIDAAAFEATPAAD